MKKIKGQLFIHPICLSEGKPPEEIQVLPVGEWDHPSYRKFKINERDLQEFVENFNAGIHVTSVMQDLDAECGGLRHPTFYPMSDRNGLEAVRRQVDTIKHHPAIDMGQAADGVVVWKCRE